MALRILLILVGVIIHSSVLAQEGSGDPQRPLKWQILLEREGFSPGLLDNKPGAKSVAALDDYLKSRGIEYPQTPDECRKLSESLKVGEIVATVRYVIKEEDVAKLTGPTPKGWMEKSKAKSLGYGDLQEMLAERFHCSQEFLKGLNPGVDFRKLKAGDAVMGVNVQQGSSKTVSRLKINLGEKMIRGYDKNGVQVCLFHCSIASKENKRPTGKATVTGVTMDPVYRWDPKMYPEVKGINKVLMIPRGANNPVGLCWIGLSLPGYGIHGNPNPELIGKTGSHGCFRLTNWDAVRLGGMVKAGVTVEFDGK